MQPATRKIGCDADRGNLDAEAPNPLTLSVDEWKAAKSNAIVKALYDEGKLTVAGQRKGEVDIENRTRSVLIIPVGTA